jgi:hypothetical protein
MHLDKKKGFEVKLPLEKLTEDELLQVVEFANALLLDKRKSPARNAQIPLSIFSGKLNPSEAIAKYMHENLGFRICSIAKAIGRSENSVWMNYSRAKKRHRSPFKESQEGIMIPIASIATKDLSILESIIIYLRDKECLGNRECAKLLQKSETVLSTSYGRAKAKLRT